MPPIPPRMIALASLVIALCATSPAQAQRRGAGGELTMTFRGGTEVDRAAGQDERLHISGGEVDLHALYGKRLAYAAQLSFELGASVPAGFLWSVRFAPFGGALRFGHRGWIGVSTGIGGSGVTGTVPAGFELPATAFFALDLGEHVRALGRFTAVWLPASDSRGQRSRLSSGFHEYDAQFGLAVGKREKQYRAHWSDGTYVGVFAREQADRVVVGVSIAIAMSGAGGFR